MTVERRFLRILEVDGGTLVIGDPAYLLLTLLIQDLGGDGPYAAYGEYEEGELLRVVIDLERIELDPSDDGDG